MNIQMSPNATRLVKVLVGVSFGMLALIVLWRSVDYRAVQAIVGRAVLWHLALGLVAYALDFVLRAVRFWLLLDGRRGSLPFFPTIAPFVASFGINDILPLRLGDAYRVFWFHDRMKLPVGRVLGAMVLERMLDLLAIVALAGGVLLVIDADLSNDVLGYLRTVMILCLALGVVVLFSPILLERLAGYLARSPRNLVRQAAGAILSCAEAIREAGTLRRMSGMIGFSLLIWALEGAVALAVWTSLGGPLSDMLKPLFAFAVSMLGTLVPALPGHFGSFDYFGVLSLEAVGVERNFGAAVILLLHLVLWLPTAAFAVAWLALAGKDARSVFKRAP